jgi:hypothetical protein
VDYRNGLSRGSEEKNDFTEEHAQDVLQGLPRHGEIRIKFFTDTSLKSVG